MPRSAAQSTLAYLFGKLNDNEELESERSLVRKIGRSTFKREAGTAHGRVENYMNTKCDCAVSKDDMLLEKLQLFRLNDAHDKRALKNSATQMLKKLEEDMSTKSRLTGRYNAMAKWLDTRYDQPPPKDYEFRHCLKSILTFDPTDKSYGIEDVGSDHGEPALETIFLDPPPITELAPRPRRNAFGAVQLCPHSLNKIIGKTNGWRRKRTDYVIDFLTHVATLNHELVQPRAGTERAESLYFETMYNNVVPRGSS